MPKNTKAPKPLPSALTVARPFETRLNTASQGRSRATTASASKPKAPAPAGGKSTTPADSLKPRKASRKVAARKAVAGPESSGTVAVTFVHVDQWARQVVLSGEFNQWSAAATPMNRQGDGRWQATLELPPGRHSYKFVVDGRWITDPNAREQVADGFGASNSVIEVRL